MEDADVQRYGHTWTQVSKVERPHALRATNRATTFEEYEENNTEFRTLNGSAATK